MTPAEQHASNQKHAGAIPFVLDLLAFWEAMDAATEHIPATDGPAKAAVVSLYNLRQGVGTAELRDLAVTLHDSLQKCFKDWTALYGEFDAAFDWEWIPAWIMAADWSWPNVGYNHVPGVYYLTMLRTPTAEEVNATLDEPREALPPQGPEFSIPNRVLNLLTTDDDDQTERLMRQYQDADDATKKVLDDAFISLCGYSLATLIRKEEPGS